MNRLDARISAVETDSNARITSLETSFDAKITSLETSFDAKITSLETSLQADISTIDGRLVAIENRIHEMNTRLSRIEGRLGLPDDSESENEP